VFILGNAIAGFPHRNINGRNLNNISGPVGRIHNKIGALKNKINGRFNFQKQSDGIVLQILNTGLLSRWKITVAWLPRANCVESCTSIG